MVLPVYFTILYFFIILTEKRGICNILYEIVGVCIDSVTELTGFTLTSMTSSQFSQFPSKELQSQHLFQKYLAYVSVWK